jgi:heme/copper-type cytochrome/quinol oxidase subunit 2
MTSGKPQPPRSRSICRQDHKVSVAAVVAMVVVLSVEVLLRYHPVDYNWEMAAVLHIAWLQIPLFLNLVLAVRRIFQLAVWDQLDLYQV